MDHGQHGEWQREDERAEEGDPEEDEAADDVLVKPQEEQSAREEQTKEIEAYQRHAGRE